jgi:hypothetical protein
MLTQGSHVQQAYDWALHKACVLSAIADNNEPSTTEDDWWAVLRCAWKAKCGYDPSKGCVIMGAGWVDV